jgi:hypothetical protein
VIPAGERERMLAVRLCGERVLMRLESIGVERLADLRGRDASDVMFEVNLEAGRRIWHPPMAVAALQNLIDAAERDGAPPSRSAGRRRDGTHVHG